MEFSDSEQSERFDTQVQRRAIDDRTTLGAGRSHPEMINRRIGTDERGSDPFAGFEGGNQPRRISREGHARLVKQEVAIGMSDVGGTSGDETREGPGEKRPESARIESCRGSAH